MNCVVVMGVSGAGKTTLARRLARHLGWHFIEGDTLHPPANVQKMARGEPLDDADRQPFLEAVAAALVAHATPGVVATCSALKRRYRDLLRERAGTVVFLHLAVAREELQQRLAGRQGHFMPPTLLDSQLAALEPLQPDEAGLTYHSAPPLAVLALRLRECADRARGA